MTAKPETAAEVLAEMFKHAESAAMVTPLDLARFADRIERALSAQGEAGAWAHPDGRVLSASEKAAMIANTDSPFPAIAARFDIPLVRASTHPAPARVTDMLALARGAWRAGITLGNNICVQESDRENDQDGDCGWINGTAECAKRIREWADPEDAQLVELLNEAGVDTSALIAALEAYHE